jgi:hypothetical protein
MFLDESSFSFMMFLAWTSGESFLGGLVEGDGLLVVLETGGLFWAG